MVPQITKKYHTERLFYYVVTLVVNPGVSSLHIWFNSDPEVDCYLMKHYTLLRLAVAHCDVAILLLYFLIVPFLTSGFSARWNRLNCPLNCVCLKIGSAVNELYSLSIRAVFAAE